MNISIPDDATEADFQAAMDELFALRRARFCQSWLANSGPKCALLAGHDGPHRAQGQDGNDRQAVSVAWSVVPAAPGS